MIDLNMANHGPSMNLTVTWKIMVFRVVLPWFQTYFVEKETRKERLSPESSNCFQICWRNMRGYHCQYFIVQTPKEKSAAKRGNRSRIISARKYGLEPLQHVEENCATLVHGRSILSSQRLLHAERIPLTAMTFKKKLDLRWKQLIHTMKGLGDAMKFELYLSNLASSPHVIEKPEKPERTCRGVGAATANHWKTIFASRRGVKRVFGAFSFVYIVLL